MYKISEDIIKDTCKCRDDFSCLKGNDECICAIEESFNDKIYFINPDNKGICDYRMSFGYSYICNCPTRREIFKQYNK